ncbi:formate/nitrite transporter family protein [Paenibacillus apiarius]|uniref:Formate/nitrite transporter family protein n=1 Tax=Paenibacillus apiarius TaxID=46240 RepID=A0ABT4DND6_9BACL|nr:formate/nitrite transporter family protein [Paenibacillus apiarius]MCY9515464.1 formate/nitrite transporter family protein [Paenibacillus apiarius]MCY9518873.1 formate/nitrite transporter family protein [Paenibacillus apiarius]MCY9552080.1 formate/nitrite transporter family protein [Paenibacillus apiarius]MCY9557244.1 formate/nitrite transporter family protein [Paenibacillus apiarius]MCY9682578.1 formate/nitrite transporter family protein [Paenibacillus apiarius]
MAGYLKPQQIAEATVETGVVKARNPLSTMIILGFLAGAFIALGYLLYIRVTADAPQAWGSINSFIGASLFPIGLILVLLGGGELLTGNMMAVPLARMKGRISTGEMMRNLIVITLSNFVGALFVAYFFGHIVGLTASGVYLEKTVDVAGHKLHDGFLQAFISGIGCNWLVALAVWLSYGAKSFTGKIMGIWFPTMTFVAIGFQHVVANMFVIPAAIFEGHYSWGEYFVNFVPVWLGNLVGGVIFVAGAYYLTYLRNIPEQETAAKAKPQAMPAQSSASASAGASAAGAGVS